MPRASASSSRSRAPASRAPTRVRGKPAESSDVEYTATLAGSVSARSRGGRKPIPTTDEEDDAPEPEEEDEQEDEDEEEENHTHTSNAASASAAAAAASDDFDMTNLIAQASSSLITKLSGSTTAARRVPAGSTNVPRVVESSSNLDDLFSRMNGSNLNIKGTPAASAAALVPAGFVRKNGVLHLTSEAESSAAAQSAEAPQATAPDLLAAIGAKGQLEVYNPVQADKSAKKNAHQTAGSNWFNFSRPKIITNEMKRDLQLLSLRAYMDPKKFYKKESKKKKIIPTFFQMGTVIEGAQDFYSSRLSNSERTEHYADAFVNPRKNVGEVKKMKNYLKRKTMEVQEANQPAPKHYNKKRKQMEDASKRSKKKQKY